MGYFSFFPQEGVKYKLRVETDKYNRIFDLPEAQSQGLMLAVDATETDSVRMAIAATDSLRHKAIGISITCRGKLLHFNVYDGIPKRPIRLPTIAKNRLSPGVNQVTLFDADGQVYAERLFFVHDTAVVGRKLVEYQLDKEEYKPFEKINLMLQSRRGGPMCPPEKDVVADSGRHIGLPLQVASLSVRDSGTEIGTAYSENLQTYLLLTSDLRGYIHRPEYYFEADDSVHRTALDLLMMTQGWRRYAWKQLAGVEKFEKTHIEENGLVLIGQIKQAGRKKRNLIKTPVAYSISDNLKKMQWGRTVTDNNGNFTIDFEPFVGRKRFNISVKHRSSNGVQVLLHRHFSPKPRIFYEKECSIESTPMPLQSTSGQFLFDQSNLLDNITVNKNRKRMLTFSFYNIKEEREKYLDLGEKTDDNLETKNYVIHRRGEPEWPPMFSWRFYKVKDGEEIFIGERVCKYGCSIIDEVDYIIVYDRSSAIQP